MRSPWPIVARFLATGLLLAVYYALHGTATDPQRGMWSDFTIDLDAFRALLDEMEAA